jgi:hypothetical protein
MIYMFATILRLERCYFLIVQLNLNTLCIEFARRKEGPEREVE